MRDESLRELERALDAAPDDPALRIRLAAALGRTGRRGEALARLAGAIPDEHREEAARLAAELWREELGALERVAQVPGAQSVDELVVDPSGTCVAWSSRFTGLQVTRIADGTVVFADARYVPAGLVASRSRIFSIAGRAVASVDLADGTRTVRRGPADTRLIDVSPDGALVHLQDRHHEGVYAWPSLEPLVQVPCYVIAGVVDWGARVLVVPRLARIEAHAFDGGGASSLPVRGGTQGQLVALGRGLVAKCTPGLTVLALPDRWARPLVARTHHVPAPSLSADGRALRIVLGGVPLRVALDPATGAVDVPDLLERRAAARFRDAEDANVLWHPRADAVLHRRGGGFYELRDLGGAVLRRLPGGAWPRAWVDEGRALLTLRTAGEGKAWIELWRA